MSSSHSRPDHTVRMTADAKSAPGSDTDAPSGSDEATVVDGKGNTGPRTSPAADTGGRAPATHLRLFEVLGQGGMGKVYRAEQLELERPVAFKQLLDADSEHLRDRFVREARITAQLDHPNIVPVYVLEVSAAGKALGYAMKLVAGDTLRTLVVETAKAYEKGAPIDAAHALPARLEHFLKICDAMAFAHARGILHRDLKPANIMIGKFGEVYVMDWGIARPIGSAAEPSSTSPRDPSDAPHRALPGAGNAELTRDGDVVGSALYMSPEQASLPSNELDARADQYALGLILYELVSLRRARDASGGAEVFTEAVRGTKAPLEHVSKRERIPSELRAIIEKATAFSRDDRYASVADLAEDVRRYMQGEAVAARPDNVLGKLLRAMSKHRRTTLVLVLAALSIAVVAVSAAEVRRTESELRARRRGELTTAFYIDVAAQGHRLDTEFQRLEEALEGLRTAAEWALVNPEPTGEAARYYLDTDFADPSKRPPDFTKNTKYRWPVSIDFPVVGVAPGTDRAAIAPKLRRLAPLRHHMFDMIAAADLPENATLTPERTRRALLDREGPIDYAYVDTPEGIHMVWPGVDALPSGYDVRTSSFYRMSDHKRGKRWGAPYIDATTDEQGDDLVLPCTEGLWSPTGEFLGVAGVEITVTKIVETALALPHRATLRASLVNGDGMKIIDSNDAGKRFESNGIDESLELVPFDIPEVRDAATSMREGVREVKRGKKDVVVAFVRLEVLGWLYVVEVESSALGDR